MWFFESLFFAFWSSTSTAITKRLVRSFNAPSMLFLSGVFTVPFVIVFVYFLYGIPKTSPFFYVYILISALLDILAALASFQAIKTTQISLLAPIGVATPVFTTLFALLFLGETPTLPKIIGILLIVLGAYSLNIKDVRKGFFIPIKNLASNRGVQLVFLASLIWAITPIFQKKAIFLTTPHAPLLVSAVGIFLSTLFIAPFTFKKVVRQRSQIKNNILLFLAIGFFGSFAQAAALTAYASAYLGYVTAIFRLSTLFTIFFGWYFFKETNIRERFLGAAVMLIGVLLLAL